jgi:hypothetical protein
MWHDFDGIMGEVVNLMAELLSSSIGVGLSWGWPRSAANCLKWVTIFAVRDRRVYSLSMGLRGTPLLGAE